MTVLAVRPHLVLLEFLVHQRLGSHHFLLRMNGVPEDGARLQGFLVRRIRVATMMAIALHPTRTDDSRSFRHFLTNRPLATRDFRLNRFSHTVSWIGVPRLVLSILREGR